MTLDITQIAHKLSLGATLLYPTDTIWGLGCSAIQPDAIEHLYSIKQRDHSKSMLILVSDERMLRRFIPNPDPRALDLLLNSDRPTTIIFPNPQMLPENLLANDGTIGVRVPKHAFCQQIIQLMDAPLVSTSANLSGDPSPACFDDIPDRLKQKVDIVADPSFDSSRGNSNQSSRILKVVGNEIITIRS